MPAFAACRVRTGDGARRATGRVREEATAPRRWRDDGPVRQPCRTGVAREALDERQRISAVDGNLVRAVMARVADPTAIGREERHAGAFRAGNRSRRDLVKATNVQHRLRRAAAVEHDEAAVGRHDRVVHELDAGRRGQRKPRGLAVRFGRCSRLAAPPTGEHTRTQGSDDDRRGEPRRRPRRTTTGALPSDAAGPPRWMSSSTMRASAMSCSRFFRSRSRQRLSSRSEIRRRVRRQRSSSRCPAAAPRRACPRSSRRAKSRVPVSISNSDDAERPDVRALVGGAAARLLRTHVRRRAENYAGGRRLRGQRRRVHRRPTTRSIASRRRTPWPARNRGPSPRRRRSTLMFAGLRSRWTMPRSCAASSASAICVAIGSASCERHRAAIDPRQPDPRPATSSMTSTRTCRSSCSSRRSRRCSDGSATRAASLRARIARAARDRARPNPAGP